MNTNKNRNSQGEVKEGKQVPENQTLSTHEVKEDGKIKDIPNNATIGMRSSLFRTPRVSSIAVIRVRIQE